ncbi:MAG: SRPBCC domain-containing protein [Chitinophagaceae bacterium]|nr:SRPBCC domain-containing protein [Chitinophagaceae bacterium]
MASFKKYFEIQATPEELYNALTNPLALKLWTGEEAIMSTEPNSEFSWWEDSIVGRNIAFEENKMIKQVWYFGDENPDSEVIFKFHEHKKGTSLEVSQTNIPDEDFDDVLQGWENMIIGNLIDFFEGE